MAGVGFDAEVVRRVPARLEATAGLDVATRCGRAKLLAGYRPGAVTLQRRRRDAARRTCYWLLLGNTRSYGGVIDITSEALVDDGLLDAYVFAGQGVTWVAATAAEAGAAPQSRRARRDVPADQRAGR